MQRFRSFDGASIAFRDMGEGRPVLLLHGYLTDARSNWVEPGIARTLVTAGFRAVMPDLRGHGDSMRSHDADDYPADAFARDQRALLAKLDLEDYEARATTSRAELMAIRARTLLLSGADDAYIASLEALRGLIPGSESLRVPGDHVDTVSRPEFARALVEFLTR